MNLYPNPHGPGCYWHEAAQRFGAPNLKWCEETLCQVISEPANTWSNLSYFIAAIVVYLMVRKRGQWELTWLAPAMLIQGAGSFYYHMSNFYYSQVIDFVGMYIFLFWLLTLNFRKVRWIGQKSQIPVYLTFITIFSLLVHWMYRVGIHFQLLVSLGVLLVLITEFIAYRRQDKVRSYRWLILGLLFTALAQTFSQLDLQRVWCEPSNHFWQGHALWHFFSAIGLIFATKHWLQEDFKKV